MYVASQMTQHRSGPQSRRRFSAPGGSRRWAVACVLMLAAMAGSAWAEQSVTLVWEADASQDIAGYNIYYGLLSGVYTTELPAGNTTNITVQGLTEGVTYFFIATAFNTAGGESDPSVEISFTVPGVSGAEPPLILTDPLSQVVSSGDSVTLQVSVVGSDPKQYQWRKDGVDIMGANNATLTIAPFQPGDVGAYTVVVSNRAGSVTSQAAALSIQTPPSLGLGMFSGFSILTIRGPIGQTCLIEYADNPRSDSWQVLTTLQLSSNPAGWLDFGAASAPRRFYRATFSP